MAVLRLTAAQLRMINAALALYEAEATQDDYEHYRQDVMDRTRAIVWDAMPKDAP